MSNMPRGSLGGSAGLETQLEETVDDVARLFETDHYRRLHSFKKQSVAWLPRSEPLSDLEVSFFGGARKGEDRCNAIGLMRGDCREAHEPGSIYCYYHTKVVGGLLDASEHLYPVWPLPAKPWRFARDLDEISA